MAAAIPSCGDHGGTYVSGCESCKVVNRMRVRVLRRKSPERFREVNRRSYDRNAEARKADAADYRRRNPPKVVLTSQRYGAVVPLANNAGRRWTPEEDAIALREDITPTQIATRLGRTYESVTTRRKRLYAKQGASA